MKKLALLCLFYFNTLLLFSMSWPSIAGVMIRNFGSNDQGKPILGISFRSEGPIMAADHGELLFHHGNNNGASRLTSPLGNWVALDHGGGIISIYSRMAKNAETNIPYIIARNSPLGESGTSGWTEERGVYFSLFDRKERRWINPAMIATPLPPSTAPQILSVRLRDSEGRLVDIPQAGTISQGRYAILVEAAEVFPAANRSPLAPFRIITSINGSETGRLNFETYSARDGSLMVNRNGLVPVRQIFAPYPAFELGTVNFTRGQITMEIITQNAAGLSRNAVFRFQVE